MEATSDRFAYRCLPLLIANQSGWWVLSRHTVLATWDGGPGPGNLEVQVLRGSSPVPTSSHFGHGILTWSLPYLFRTSPGYNLLMRGPANLPKDGACALEGTIETDWAPATATMNWKLTRPGLTVRFDAGDPICALVPQRRGELEAFDTRTAELADDPELGESHRQWATSRSRFLRDLRDGQEPQPGTWQKHYFHGRAPDGRSSPDHQRRLRLGSFGSSPARGAEPGREREGPER